MVFCQLIFKWKLKQKALAQPGRLVQRGLRRLPKPKGALHRRDRMGQNILAKVRYLLLKAANDSCDQEEARTAAFLAARLICGNHLVLSEPRRLCVRCGHPLLEGQQVLQESWGGLYHKDCVFDD